MCYHHPTKPMIAHVLISLQCFFSRLLILSKLFAHITTICVQGSLKLVRVWKAMESTGGSKIHKHGRAMIQREAALLCSSKLKSIPGNIAATACLGWFLLTWPYLTLYLMFELDLKLDQETTAPSQDQVCPIRLSSFLKYSRERAKW